MSATDLKKKCLNMSSINSKYLYFRHLVHGRAYVRHGHTMNKKDKCHLHKAKSGSICIKSVVRTVVLRVVDSRTPLKRHSFNQPLWYTVINKSLEKVSDSWCTNVKVYNLTLILT